MTAENDTNAQANAVAADQPSDFQHGEGQDALRETFAQALAFVGNSMLKPMTQTETAGINPEFWQAFPTFGSDAVAQAAQGCASCVSRLASESDDPVLAVSVEYTKLFVGPPAPAAAPWETMYRSPDASYGFGPTTFEMQDLLRKIGLEVSNENNQYADHMGIELLYLSELCRRGASPSEIAGFVTEHPLLWIDAFQERVRAAYPNGYFDNLLSLERALLDLLAKG